MKVLIMVLLCAAVAFSSEDNWLPTEPHGQEPVESKEFVHRWHEDIMSAVAHLRANAQEDSSVHAENIARHVELIQGQIADTKAKAYAHNFKKSKAALRAAIAALNNQLKAGHRHDKNALAKQRRDGNNMSANARRKGRGKVQHYKNKACPARQAEQEAAAKMRAAKGTMNRVGKQKICQGLGTTFGSMDVDKSTPSYGTELRNKWDRQRKVYVKHQNKYHAAKKAHAKALNVYNRAMASFKTSLSIEAGNAYRTCQTAHREYNTLKRDVANNVNSRKQVWIATLVVECYVKNLTNNRAAKACANRQRKANTSRWNINAGSLGRCVSKSTLENQWGPKGWIPTSRNCHAKHWHERKHKASAAKEKSTKRNAKLTCVTRKKSTNNAGVVRVGVPKGYTLTGGGMNNRYRKWDAKSGFEESYPDTHHSHRCDTGFGPGQLDCYSRSCKTNVGALSCTTRSTRFKGSGYRVATLPGGYTLTGCGLFNHYRSWNAKAGFEEFRPHGNGCGGDMGFGWGDYTVYARGCKAPRGHKLNCKTVATGRGNKHTANCPGGYVMTGCGIKNYSRKWNAKAGIEETGVPSGNGCLCDTGFGKGDNVCYAQCCKLN